jgi:spore coat protein JB
MEILIQEVDIVDRQQKELLHQIMEASFVLVETNLYLDTHPNDQIALGLHNDYSRKYNELVNIYEKRYSPLSYTEASRDYWSYVDAPWPWDIEFPNY